MDFRRRQQKARELLATGNDAELGRLLHGVDGIGAGVGETDNLRLRALRLQQERREIRRVERVTDRAKHLAAVGLHYIAGVLFQRMTEGIVRRQEVPGITARFHERAAGADRQCVGVERPVETVRRARRARDRRRGRADHDIDLLLFLGDFLHRERDRRGRQLGDHVDAFGVVPLARNADRQIRLVLMIGRDDLDLAAQHLAAEFLDRDLRGLDRALAAVIGIDARLIIQDADLDALRQSRQRRRQAEGRDCRRQKLRCHHFAPSYF